jgi:predicted 2-oxoglutarate/Fe(II)-dependent dioxygenase YbiX
LAALLGGAQQRRLASLYGSRADRIAIRRVAAAGQSNVIAFHTDTGSFKTMQVPLNEESEYDGGRLVYATSNGFLKPERLPGSYTIHHWNMPHGVTALRRGARYSLFMQTTCRLSYSSASASENGCISSS